MKNLKVEENEVSIISLLLVIARQLKIITYMPVVFSLVAILYVQFIAEPVYTSSSKIISTLSSGSVSQASGIAAQFGITLNTSSREREWSLPEIIKSRSICRNLLQKKK